MARRSIERAEERLQVQIEEARAELEQLTTKAREQQVRIDTMEACLADLQASPEEKGDDS